MLNPAYILRTHLTFRDSSRNEPFKTRSRVIYKEISLNILQLASSITEFWKNRFYKQWRLPVMMLEYFGQFYGPTFYYCSSLAWFQ